MEKGNKMFKKLFLSFFIFGMANVLGKEDLDKIIKEAEAGNPEYQYQLGDIYRYKDNEYGVPMNHKKAFIWYEKAAEQGHAIAQFQLGDMYEWGTGVKKDELEALKWYRKSAKQDYAEAQFVLGSFYWGYLEDEEESIKWYEKAAQNGNKLAPHSLIKFYIKKNNQENVKKWLLFDCEKNKNEESCDEAKKLK